MKKRFSEKFIYVKISWFKTVFRKNNFLMILTFIIKSNKTKSNSETFEKSRLLVIRSTKPAKSKVELFAIVIKDVFV